MRNRIILQENLSFLKDRVGDHFDLIYIDPPFNTGKNRILTTLKTNRDDKGDRVGFQNKKYKTEKLGTLSYSDKNTDYIRFLQLRLQEAHRILKSTGSLFLHLDYREVHYAKVLLDSIFGRECFMNEIIWAYDYGGRSKKRWSPKHDNILWYAKDPNNYTFNYEDIDRVPYMAPKLVGKEKAARGKTPTSVWWHTIVPTNSKERTGYPTQKPLGLLKRLVAVHSNPGDNLLDFFAGAGTLGEAAGELDRRFVLVDNNKEALEIMKKRLERFDPVVEDRLDLPF